MVAPVPASGPAAFSDIKAAFPNINSNSLADYRGRQFYVAGTGNIGTFNPTTLKMSDFRNTIYSQTPRFANPNGQWNLGSVVSLHCCYRAGWIELSLRLYNGNLYLAATGILNDYTYLYNGGGTSGYLNNFENIMIAFPNGPMNAQSGVWGPQPYGRDNTAFYLVTTVVPGGMQVDVYADCKAGGCGWSVFYSVFIPAVWGNPGLAGQTFTPGTAYRAYKMFNGARNTRNTNWVTVGHANFRGNNGSAVAVRAMSRGAFPAQGRVLHNGQVVASVSSRDNNIAYSGFVNVGCNYGDVFEFQTLQTTGGGGEIYTNENPDGYFTW